MTTEEGLWQRVTRSIGERAAGFFPGALTGGALVAVRRPGGNGSLEYRGFTSDSNGSVTEHAVSGLEVIPDYTAARRVGESSAGAHDLGAALRTGLGAGEAIVGTLPTSDGATFVAVGAGSAGPLRLLSGWPDEGGSAVVVPARLQVPVQALIAVGAIEPAAAAPRREPAPPAPETPAAPRRPYLGVLSGVGALAAAAAIGWFVWQGRDGTGQERQGTRPDSPTPVPPPAAVTTTPSESTLQPTLAPPPIDSPRTTQGRQEQKSKAVPNAGSTTQVPRQTEPVPRVDPQPDLPPPRVDSERDVRDLNRLRDQAVGTQQLSGNEWLDLARNAERLFGRLVEARHRSEAARVVLQASGRGGGNAEACKYLQHVTDLTAAERTAFSALNRCG